MTARHLVLAALVAWLALAAWPVVVGALPQGQAAQQPRSEPATVEQLATLQRILARPEFQAAEGRGVFDTALGPIQAWIRTYLDPIRRALLQALGSLAGAEPTRYGVAGVSVLAALVVLLIVLRLSRGGLLAEAELAMAAAAGPPRAEAELARAEALARAGKFRAAAHHRYLAALRRLDQRGLLPFDPSLTNREHLVRAGASPPVAEALAPLVQAYDGLWYGQDTCTAEEYGRFAALADGAWHAGEMSRSEQSAGRQWSVE